MRRVVITGQGTINALGQDVPATPRGDARGALRDRPAGAARRGASFRCGSARRSRATTPRPCFNRQPDLALRSVHAIHHDRRPSGAGRGGANLRRRSRRALGGGSRHRGRRCEHLGRELPLGLRGGQEPRSPFRWLPKLMNNAAASHVSMEWNLKGPSFSVATACASSNHAMGLAFQLIRGGGADVMVTGGSEAMLSFGGVKAWEGLRVMSKDACRPFSANRNGMVQGEGAAVFVFEEREQSHGARRHDPRRSGGLRHDVGRGPTSSCPASRGAARRDHRRASRRAARPVRNRLYQRPWHRNGGQRQGRMRRRGPCLRSPCGRADDLLDEVHARPPDRRHRRGGSFWPVSWRSGTGS